LARIQKRLSHIHYAHIVHRRRAIIAFEGWDAAGKGGIIQRLTGEWDPRYYEVWPIAAPTQEELAHHFLWRFWRRLPAQHNIAI
ncbi:polyphosphate kinase, partial [Escherichia coli]|nr:polyphosphate kinase [Escherichia coli]